MNKLFRTKSEAGGLTVRLDQIVTIQYSNDGDGTHSVEILTTQGQKDTVLTSAELEELNRALNAAL